MSDIELKLRVEVEAKLRAEIDVLKQECRELREGWRYEILEKGQAWQEIETLRARLAGAEAANAAIDLVEHVELNGHIDVAEQCRDHLMAIDNGDWGGKLQDFADSLRIVIDQLDRQRRSRNWYEVAYHAGKQKLIEYALAKQAEQIRPALEAAQAALYDAMHAGNLSREYHDSAIVKIEAALAETEPRAPGDGYCECGERLDKEHHHDG